MIELIRFRSGEQGTFGALIVPGYGSLVTVEREWLDRDETGKHWPWGADRRSCIPAGIYRLSREHSNKFGKVMWHIIGDGVTYMDDGVLEHRSNVMFHGANKASELEGCIAPGLIYDPTTPQVLRSQTALGQLATWLGEIKAPTLRVRNAW